MGALGLLSAQTLQRDKHRHVPFKHHVVGLVAGIMLFTLYGLAPGTDIVAHFGGFVSGVILGFVLVHAPAAFLQRRRSNLVSGVVLAGLVALSWGLALEAGK
jgi:membrane associated rhomboid family serine protease